MPVACVSYNKNICGSEGCHHKHPHRLVAECSSKVTCMLATIRGLKGWCKEYKAPRPKVVYEVRRTPVF